MPSNIPRASPKLDNCECQSFSTTSFSNGECQVGDPGEGNWLCEVLPVLLKEGSPWLGSSSSEIEIDSNRSLSASFRA